MCIQSHFMSLFFLDLGSSYFVCCHRIVFCILFNFVSRMVSLIQTTFFHRQYQNSLSLACFKVIYN